MARKKTASFGNPSNQNARSFRGATTEQMRTQNLAGSSPAGQSNRVVSYAPESVRTALESQLCPFCGKGPFRVVASHVIQAHGIDKYELRSLAGLLVSDSICDPATSQRRREIALSRDFGHANKTRGGSRRERKFTKAGKAKASDAIRAKASTNREAAMARGRVLAERFVQMGADVDALERLAKERAITRYSMRKYLIKHGCEVPKLPAVRPRLVNDESIEEIVKLYQSGLKQAEIAGQFGIHQSTVSKVLVRRGITGHSNRGPR